MAGAWLDPYDPRIWSGVITNILRQLAALGLLAGYLDVTPWPFLARPTLHWIRHTGRAQVNLPTTLEMRAIIAAANTLRRRRLSGPDAWLVPASATGLPVPGRIISVSEVSPSALLSIGAQAAASFGMAGLTHRGLRSIVRQQHHLHRKAYACCVASSWAANGLLNDGIPNSRIHVVGWGRNLVVEPPSERDWSTPSYLFVGRDWTRKNGDAVINAFLALRREHPNAELHLVGNHPRVSEPGIVGHGMLDVEEPSGRDRLRRLFQRATCFVMPSFIEPFGIVYLEAAGAGIPSIGTSIGGTSTSIGEGGARIHPRDQIGLLAAMRRFADPGEARGIGQAALKHCQAFDWSKTTQRIVAVSGLPVPRSDIDATPLS